MFKKLIQFEVYYQLKQRAFPIFALLFLALGVFIGRQGFAPAGVNFNAVYQVYFYTNILTLASVFITMFFAISAMLRDKQYDLEGLIYSSSIKKSHYFWSRFIGTFIFSVLAFSPFLFGYFLGITTSNLDTARIADFQFMTYLQPWLYIVVPNIFICSTIIFSVSTLTKNSTATYVSAVFVYMLYFVSSIFLNSPLMAQAVPASPESMVIAAIADPFGIAAFFEQTQFWTPFQKNTQLLSFSGIFLMNRIIWMLVSVGFLLVTYKLFSFRKITKKVKKEPQANKEEQQLLTYKPIKALHNFKAQRYAFFSLLSIELKNVFRSLPFIAVLLMWLFIVFSELYSTVISGGQYGVSVYPFTNQLLDLFVDPLSIFSLILITFYSSEIVWKERNLNFNSIVDATPGKNWVFFLSKLSALLLLPIILMSTGIIICMLFQVGLNYSNFEFSLYASLFYYYGVQLVVYSMIALFVNNLVQHKYMGMGIFGLIVILSLKSGMLGLEHPLTSIGFMPRVTYNNMNGFSDDSILFDHLALFWFALGLLLVIVSFKIWNRGVVAPFSTKLKQLKYGWSALQKIAFTFLMLLFIGAGSLVFYNVNILSVYETSNDDLDFRENYERKFKQYEILERPIATSKKTEVALYPNERKYTVKAHYILKNKSDKPLSKVFIHERISLEKIAIENADLVAHDSFFSTYLFQFKKALQPNDSVKFSYEFEKSLKGYDEDNSIVKNGSYISDRNFEPVLGYGNGLEITNSFERQKRGLPERVEENNTDAHVLMEDVKNEKIRFETIISTEKGQTALSSGSLIKAWSENERNYYHYKSKDKILPVVAYFSAKYKTQKTIHNEIAIEQYYDAKHHFNIDNVENSIKQTLDYCQENFGAYNFGHIRIAEIPAHWPFGGFAHPGMISMVEDRLYLTDQSNPETFNLVAKRTIHEVAHQWWGHTLSAKPVAGGSLLIEGFAKYTEAVVLEKMYGKRAIFTLNEDSRRRYFTGRSYANELEPPVYKVTSQGYISYGKALTVMLALRDLIGEKQVNYVLKTITDKHRNKNKLDATSIEFLEELYKVTSQEQHILIDDWFKKVITYDLGIEDSSYKVLVNGTYEITAKVKAKRFKTLDTGEIKEIAINEPIKIGVFTAHPSIVKDDSTLLYYESNTINKEETIIKIIVKELPKYIAIDPYGTRSDENFTDNIISL
ncbi:M1 family aminopeptidase [Lutimonas halocynthiae]|uniref:M1 family aminopeptidase n=1 Tax=Lutimonas halocynthiae TaxID=1446477 RepID=UPI0025B3A1EF|nr:M1 family aminopeptidase [Lutimonas halocynthiae]MDN3644010.1 M1 family aminopeptidase [Lutimonas halocynthiae]